MKLEWFTTCRHIDDTDFPTFNLFGANAGGVLVEDELPTDIDVNLALCLLVEGAEVDHGGVLTIRAAVFREDRSLAGWRREELAVEQGDPLPQGFERRQIFSMAVTFRAESEGPHRIAVGIEGEESALAVSYGVFRLPAT